MKHSRFLIRVVPGEPDRQRFLTSLKTIGRSIGANLKHPRWTSYGALEIDAFTPSPYDFDLFVAAIEPLSKVEFTKNLDEPPAFRTKEEIIQDAIDYFNSERYWECHETLESIWRPSVGEEKRLIQGIILICAALVHVQRDEREVALDIYKRALPQLEWNAKTYHGIDVPRLRKNVESSLEKRDPSPFKIWEEKAQA